LIYNIDNKKSSKMYIVKMYVVIIFHNIDVLPLKFEKSKFSFVEHKGLKNIFRKYYQLIKKYYNCIKIYI